MNPGASLLRTATAAAIVAAVSLSVIAGGYALFLVARDAWGPAAAAGVVAGAGILLALIIGLIAWFASREVERYETEHAPPGLTDHLIDMALKRPIASAAVATAAGVIFLRNPRLAALALELLAIGGVGRKKK